MTSSHKIFCGFAPETGAITESADGFTPAVLPAAPQNFALCGYQAAPGTDRGLNNSLGYSISSDEAAYRKRGARNPKLSIVLKGLGALSLLQNAVKTNGVLPSLCFFVGVPGEWTELYRFAKIGTLDLDCTESPQGEASEISATLGIEASCVQDLEEALNPNLTALRTALGAALFWHDVRAFSIDDSAGNTLGLRRAVSSIKATISHNLERKNERNDWGDDEPLSNTNYELLEHNITVSGQLGFHKKLDRSLLSAAARSQDWGDIVLRIGDFEQTQLLDLTLRESFPQNVQGQGVEAGQQLSWNVPFVAKGFDLTISQGD